VACSTQCVLASAGYVVQPSVNLARAVSSSVMQDTKPRARAGSIDLLRAAAALQPGATLNVGGESATECAEVAIALTKIRGNVMFMCILISGCGASENYMESHKNSMGFGGQ
jgi:hypothetical protein